MMIITLSLASSDGGIYEHQLPDIMTVVRLRRGTAGSNS